MISFRLPPSTMVALAFLTGVAARAQDILQPVINAVSSENPLGLDRSAMRMCDGSGLTNGASGIPGAADATHGRVANGAMWTSRGNTAVPADKNPSITFDLGAATDLHAIRIWNYNENTFTRFGARAVRVSTSADNAVFTPVGDIEVALAGSTTTEPAQEFPAVAPATRYVRFQILSNWDGASFWSTLTGADNGGTDGRYLVGLSEVRFTGTPATLPATAVSNPSPAHGVKGVEPDAALAWDTNDAGSAATAYRVRIGVGAPALNYLVHTGTLAAVAAPRMSWTPPAHLIQKDMSFWWQVDKQTAAGEVPGPVWTFAARPETGPEKDARMAWFREGRFFGAIVWGLYSGAEGVWPPQTGTRGAGWTYAEWMQYWKSLPSLTYRDSLEPYVTGVNFDAAAMARLCKQAGMEMVYVMPRHHDGYAIWDTATTTTLAPAGFKITNSPHNPARRDYLKELVDALRAEGLRVGFYFSLGDWHHPDFPRDGSWAHPQQGQAVPGADWSRYVEYLYQQVREIVDPATGTDYGRFDAVYFDYSTSGINGEEWGATRLVHLVRRYQPGILINNRLWNGLDNPNGDFATPEASIDHLGYNQLHRDWEAIMSANSPPTWGYGRPDLYPFKTAAGLVRDIVHTAAKGGTIELSVSPKGDGSLHADQIHQYEDLGAWMALNGEAIKGASANPLGIRPSWGEYTARPGADRLYLHVLDRPADGVIDATGLSGTCRRAWLLADPSRTLPVTGLSNGFQVTLPAAWADPLNTVIVVEYVFPDAVLRPATVAAVSSENILGLDRDANHAVDSSGLSAGSVGSEHAEGESGIAWTTVGSLGPGTDFDPFITFDLGEVCDVRAIREWGYNAAFPTLGSALSKIGPRTVDVHAGVDGVNFAFVASVQFARAPGAAGYLGNTVALDAPGVRFLRLDIRDNHDGAVFDGSGAQRGGDGRSLTGLSEIRFVTGPPGAYLRIPHSRYDGASMHVRAEGMDLGRSYRLMRSLALPWSSPVLLEGPRPPQATIDDFTDPSPPARAYYRIEEAP